MKPAKWTPEDIIGPYSEWPRKHAKVFGKNT